MNRPPEWYEERKKHVGASEVAAILGLSQYETPYSIWAVKTGQMEPFSGNEATKLGQDLEPVILNRAEEDLGELKRDVVCLHPDKILRATLDGQLSKSGDVIEAKTAGLISNRVSPEWGDDGLVERDGQVPRTYFVQVQAQLLCSGAELAWLYALIAGRGIARYRIMPDTVLQQWMVERVGEWWERHIVKGEPPSVGNTPVEMLKRIRRDDAKSIELDAEVTELCEQYRHWAEEERRCKKRKDDFAKLIIGSLGDAAEGICPDGTKVAMPLVQRKGFTVEPTEYRQLRIKQGIAK